MGISSAHVGSPHASVLDATLPLLGDGRAWTTTITAGGAGENDPLVVNADGGRIVLRTTEGGRGYVVQAQSEGGAVIETRAYGSVRCTR